LSAVLALTVAAPAWAADVKPTQPQTQPQTISLAAATEASVAKLDKTSAALATQASSPAASETSSKPFLKSPKGIAVILLMAVGTGYAVYTATNERIDNPVR
jgi:hypothetical protein